MGTRFCLKIGGEKGHIQVKEAGKPSILEATPNILDLFLVRGVS
jgi:hypothetical protein